MQKNNFKCQRSNRTPSYVNKQLRLLNKGFICSHHTHIIVLLQQTVNMCWANKPGLWIWTSIPNKFFLLGQLTLFNSVFLLFYHLITDKGNLPTKIKSIAFPLLSLFIWNRKASKDRSITSSIVFCKWNCLYMVVSCQTKRAGFQVRAASRPIHCWPEKFEVKWLKYEIFKT